MAKGSSFERKICKQLSLWWSGGKRDDIFWRSSQSGGRATQRSKSGRKTFGSYGDIAAVDPIGLPLLEVFTIELKTGKSHGTVADVLDWKAKSICPNPFEKTINQAYRSHQEADSQGWMIISRRLGRIPVVYADLDTMKAFNDNSIFNAPCVRFNVFVNTGNKRERMRFIALGLEAFLQRVSPSAVKTLA